ncbi:regulator of nonsense-mediated decay, partial [Thamnocephalis sphaerospora]
KENRSSCAYIRFRTVESMLEFHRAFDGHVFINSQNEESRAVVERAPYQKVPKERSKKDAYQGSIEEGGKHTSYCRRAKD